MGAEAVSTRSDGSGRSGAGRSGAGRAGAGKAGAGKAGAGRAGSPGSGRTKSGKPRPGTGGYGRRALEGKGPTPPAAMRPGHPAQRRAAAAAAGSRGPRRSDDTAASRGPRRAGESAASPARAARGAAAASGPSARGAAPSSGPSARASRGSGDAPEFVAGRNPVVESLRAAVPSVALYVGARAQHDERISEAIKLAANRGVAVLEAGPAELDRLTGGALHQGLALRVRPYDYAHPDDLLARAADVGQLPLIVALDGVTDPRNLGAVARSAGAFGAHGVVVPARRGAGVTAGAWKASAGALARVPVARAANLARTLASYQDAGLFVAGLDAAGDTPVRDLELATAPLVLVIGSEGRGLSRIVARTCDVLVRIPIAARSESLNAGVAAGITLYEVAAIRSRPTTP
jgi:23S rRNA (guanosine2251-2'-O)-methyltransferase